MIMYIDVWYCFKCLTPFIIKQPTNMKSTVIPSAILLALTFFWLTDGYSFPTVGTLRILLGSLTSTTFSKVAQVLVSTMYYDYVGEE